MRYKEFIVEYSREKTATVFGNKLLSALLADKSHVIGGTALGTARAYLQQKAKINSPIEDSNKTVIINDIMQSLENADPTANKEYVQWLAKVYANQGIKMEDLLARGHSSLQMYHKFKTKKILPIEYRDIGRIDFNTLEGLAQSIPLLQALHDKEEQETAKTMPKGEANTVFENDQVRIVVPEDKEAACYYGQGTRWCTAASNNNMFDRYTTSGKLYILLPKKPQYEGEKYQLHFNSGQFMDEGDNQVDDPIELLTNRFGNLVDFFRQAEPEINDWMVFANDATLEPLIAKIKTAVMDRAWETISEWEVQDDYWYEWLRKEGYVYPEGHEDEGSIDYDRLTDNDIDYYSWNYDAQDYIRDHQDAVDINPDDVRRLANEIYHEWNEDILDIGKLDDIFSYNLEQQFRKETEIGKWIAENIWVKKTGTGWDVSLLGSTDPATGQRKEYPIR